MLRDLGFFRIFQIGLECSQYRIAVQLVRHAHVAVGDRDVSRFVRADRERYANQLCQLRVNAGGLGIKGEQIRSFEFIQPTLEVGLLGNGLVVIFLLGLADRGSIAVDGLGLGVTF